MSSISMKQLKLTIQEKDYVYTYLRALNGLLGLADTELAVLAAFIRYDSQVACTTEGRRYVVDQLKMKSVGVLNNYIKKLKDKKCIIQIDNGNYVYNDLVKPENYRKGIVIKFEYAGIKG